MLKVVVEAVKDVLSAQELLRLTNDANPNRATHPHNASKTINGVTTMLGGVRLQMVVGDIIHETTDVIVNTTNFSADQSGVSKAILTAAGSTVQEEFARVGIPADRYHTTGPGLLGCKEIIHASFRRSPRVFQKNCKKILKQCETKGFCSAAFPAINTGAARMDSVAACKAMLDGLTSAITDLKPNSLSLIRIVILEQAVFQAFRSELENRFGRTVTPHLTSIVLELPPHWEPMGEEVFKKVELLSTSQEYQDVAQGFLRTARYNICKIERVQNFYLWFAFTICKQRILTKNGQAELGEKFLYHGTSAESCYCIERDKFDRGFAGTNAARCGKGVYFAVNPDYSARRFAPVDASGLKRVFVARVLTGRYTVGHRLLKAAPPRGSDRSDCFDSVVDNLLSPTMFVVFHDDQAYPEYLITFN
ncbi:protein mono-ADP-ribosyltransferase PARP15-like [Halichoeres trimaculatus]|uniref:protein mono-ADP-ribosyltransferase PARP15-like n=1 Tax=Halichoeres trimaculatus TaxID=147232 RepID=UPI003D9F8054